MFEHVTHTIDSSSPLWPIRDMLSSHLKSIDVSLSAYDTAFQTPVKLYTRYQRDEIILNSLFENMQTTNDDGSITTVDHSKLDIYVRDDNNKHKHACKHRFRHLRRRSAELEDDECVRTLHGRPACAPQT